MLARVASGFARSSCIAVKVAAAILRLVLDRLNLDSRHLANGVYWPAALLLR